MGTFADDLSNFDRSVLETIGSDFGYSPYQLQRTKEWHEKRRGRFTGSKLSDLMTCDRSASKYEWGRPEKLISFGQTAIKYIYSKAKERQRGKVIQGPTTPKMNYGEKIESVILELFLEEFHDKNAKFEPCDFIEFIEGIAGASPDGRLIVNGEVFVVGSEIKAATDWGPLYDRVEIDFDQSHQDFWQVQAEMLALKTDKLYYIVAEPPENIFEPVITDINYQLVMASKIHQQALIERCMIGNDIINHYLSGMKFGDAIQKAVSEYKFKF